MINIPAPMSSCRREEQGLGFDVAQPERGYDVAPVRGPAGPYWFH